MQETCSPIGTISPAKYVEVVRARAPRGFSDAIRQAAETQQVSISEFIRAALAEKLDTAKSCEER